MQYVHKVKCKDLIKRQGRESVCFTCFNMNLADSHCWLHDAEENSLLCPDKPRPFEREKGKKALSSKK
jgi:hypothetical protein